MDLKSVNFKSEVSVADRTFAGYASTWDEDLGGDIITNTAFNKTLAERANRVKILFEHKTPIGKPLLMKPDAKGLYVEGRISKTRLGDEVLELIADEVVDQMSIGFSVPAGKSTYNDAGKRIITEVKLYEFSPVTFPMNENAFITMKSMQDITAKLKSGDCTASELKELSELLDEVKALLINEPPKGTQLIKQPHEHEIAVYEAMKNFRL